MFTRNPSTEPAFGLMTHEDPNLRSMVYWLYRHFQSYLGDFVVDVRGSAPYSYAVFSHPSWQGVSLPASGPSTPLVASRSRDGKHVSLVVVNASETNTHDVRVVFENFEGRLMASIVLRDNRQSWRDSTPFTAREQDFVQTYQGLSLAGDGKTLTGKLPSRSVLFVKISS